MKIGRTHSIQKQFGKPTKHTHHNQAPLQGLSYESTGCRASYSVARSAWRSVQYPCPSFLHLCAQSLSALVEHTSAVLSQPWRKALQITNELCLCVCVCVCVCVSDTYDQRLANDVRAAAYEHIDDKPEIPGNSSAACCMGIVIPSLASASAICDATRGEPPGIEP